MRENRPSGSEGREWPIRLSLPPHTRLPPTRIFYVPVNRNAELPVHVSLVAAVRYFSNASTLF
jgi:hypothetical protein